MSAVAAATVRPDVGVVAADVCSADAYAARLYERHHRAIFRVCLHELRGREDADDAVQTTFVYALMSLRRGVVPQFELPWLLTIARNACSTRRRSGIRRRSYEAPQDLDSMQDRLATPDRSDVATTDDFRTALGAIPESQRRALLLREWKGLSYDEIGSELGLSQAATEALLFRARQNVAQRLGAKIAAKTFNGLPLLSLVRNLFRTAAGKTIAVGAGAALTIVAVPSAQPPGTTHRVPAAASQVSTVEPSRPEPRPQPTRRTHSTSPARAVSQAKRDQVPRRHPGSMATTTQDATSALTQEAAPPKPAERSTDPAPPANSQPVPPPVVTVPSVSTEDVVDPVVETASSLTQTLGLPAVAPPPLPALSVPTLPSVHAP